MISDEALVPLLGPGSDKASLLISPPSPGWRSAPTGLARREIYRLRARSRSAAEQIIWAAPSSTHSRYSAVRQSVLGGCIWGTLPADSAVFVMRTETAFVPTHAVHIGSGGGIRQQGTWHGKPVMARFGVRDSPGDPSWHFRALEAFRFDVVPEPIGHGEVGIVHWTVESFRSGRPPHELTDRVTTEASDFLARLPLGEEPTDLVSNAAAELARWSIDVTALSGRIAAAFQALPSSVNHGDLWAGNLLFDEGHLVGVLDWDSWKPKGVPGIDLIHLYAEHLRRRQGGSYGDLVEQSFWSSESINRTLAEHYRKLNLTWHAGRAEELAATWWMAAATGALRRTPSLAENTVWMERNVQRPANRFG